MSLREFVIVAFVLCVLMLPATGVSAQEQGGTDTVILFANELEERARDQLRRLHARYALDPWIFTREVKIEAGMEPHSMPVLTLNTDFLDDTNEIGAIVARYDLLITPEEGLVVEKSPVVQAEALSLRCSGETVLAGEAEVVHQAEGELQIAWELPTVEALWQYDLPHLEALDRYRGWLASEAEGPRAVQDLTPLDIRLNQAVRQRHLGILRPMNCLEVSLLARQIHRTGYQRLREFVAYVLRSDGLGKTKIYWLSGPHELPPKDDKIKPWIRRDLQAGWRLSTIIHNHTGRAPAAAPSASDARCGVAWAEAGAERFVVLGGTLAFDVSGAELREFMRDSVVE